MDLEDLTGLDRQILLALLGKEMTSLKLRDCITSDVGEFVDDMGILMSINKLIGLQYVEASATSYTLTSDGKVRANLIAAEQHM